MADGHDPPLGDWRLAAGPNQPEVVVGLHFRVERVINCNNPAYDCL
jgi:hypothetical protein